MIGGGASSMYGKAKQFDAFSFREQQMKTAHYKTRHGVEKVDRQNFSSLSLLR